MKLLKSMEAMLLDGQYGHPKGLIGRALGEQMVRQHVTETDWTLELLHIQPEDQVLELGFGAGRAIELAAARASRGSVCGLDRSQEMVRSATRRNARTIKAGRVTLHQGEITTLPFPDNHFDKVFSIQTFYFWPDPLQILAEIFRVLKPGALLVVTLSTGKRDTDEATGLEQYPQLLAEKIIPGMQKLGFSSATSEQGPDSRQFKTTALVGRK